MTPDTNVTIERLPKGRVACTMKPEEARYGAAEAEALQRFASRMNIKGFRPGHAPADMVRAKISPDDLFEEAVRLLLRDTLPAIAEEHGIKPVVPPKVEVLSRMPITIKITFVEKPEVTVKDAAKISIEKKDIKADEKDVQRVIDSMLQEHRITFVVDRPAKEGDELTIDFHATDEKGEEIQGMRATGYKALIGSKTLLPGFEEELIGLAKDGTKSFTLTLPDKFQAEALRGKKATFHVTVKTIEEVTLPAFDDAFAKEKLQSESAAAFRTMVSESLNEQEARFDRMNRERMLMDEIRKRTKADIAEELIDEEVRGMIDEWAHRLESQGKTIAQVLEEQKKTPQETEKEMRAQAEDRWKLRLGIAKLIEERNVTATPEELEAAFADFKANLPEDRRAGAQQEWDKRGGLHEEVRWRALVDKLVEGLLA